MVKVSFEGKNLAEVITLADAFVKTTEQGTKSGASVGVAVEAPKPAKAAKGGKATPEAEVEANVLGAEGVDPTSDDLAFEDDTEVEEPQGPTIGDVTKAFKTFASQGEKQKEKAKAILKKLKVNSIKDIPEKHFDAVLKALK